MGEFVFFTEMKTLVLSLAAALLLAPSCTKINCEDDLGPEDLQPIVPIELTKAEQGVREASNTFGLNIFNRLYTAGQGEDVVFSPLSLSLALSMVAEGAAGDTWKQFSDVIGWGSATQAEVGSYYKKMIEGLVTADPSVAFTSANSYWAALGLSLKQDFESRLKANYAAEGYVVDFSSPATLDKINTWCSDKTDGKIPKMLNALNPKTQLMLINALLFKAPWALTWEIKQGRDFTGTDGKAKKDYLYVKDYSMAYGDYGDFEYLRIPYGNGAYQMDIILPREGTSLADFLPTLKAGHLSYPLDAAKVTLYLPKWSTSYSTENALIDILKAQGLTLPFDRNLADFSGISQESLYISQVIQKTQIDVTEKGTEFAAVTVIGMEKNSAVPVTPPKVTVDVNRPFAYVIRETTSGTVLLTGTLSK